MSVFDTSAVLAILYDEEGGGAAEAHLDDGVMSLVNLTEVVGDFVAAGRGDIPKAKATVDGLGLTFDAPTLEQALRAAELKRKGLSLGDRFCIALAEARSEPLITGDQDWARLTNIRVPVELIR